MTIPERLKWDLESCHPTVRQSAAGGDQPFAIPSEIFLQSRPGPSDEEFRHRVQRIDLDLKIGE